MPKSKCRQKKPPKRVLAPHAYECVRPPTAQLFSAGSAASGLFELDARTWALRKRVVEGSSPNTISIATATPGT